MQIMQSRRDFLASASLAAAAGVLGTRRSLADEAPPETTTIRLADMPAICVAPRYIAEDAAARGRVHRYPLRSGPPHDRRWSHAARSTSTWRLAAWVVSHLDAGQPITALAGVHVGCYELFAHEPIRSHQRPEGQAGRHPRSSARAGTCSSRSWRRRSGSTRARTSTGSSAPTATPWSCSPQGKVDAFLGFPPEPQELRARKIGRVILNTATDQPWSQYFCCIAVRQPGLRPRLIRSPPSASCAPSSRLPTSAPPSRSGPRNGWSMPGSRQRYDYALQTLTEMPYASWREFDPEDALRFYALRLHEVGMIKSSPNALLADGTDWRFLNELKRELKA